MNDAPVPFIGAITPEEILTFMQRPDAEDLINTRRVALQGTLADVTRIGFVLDAAVQAVPNDEHLQQLSAQFTVVIKEQTHALIRSLRARPQLEVPEKST